MNKRGNPTFITFASIIFIEQVFRVIQGSIDILVLGRVSHDAVAAVGVVNQVIAICIVIISIAAIGTNILLAYYVGENNQNQIATAMFNGLCTALFLAIILMGITIFFSEPLLELIGLEAVHLEYGSLFLKVVSISLCFHASNMICLVYLRNMQQKRLILLTLCFATAINLFGNMMSVYLFDDIEMILFAIAFMTVISQVFPSCMYVYFLLVTKEIPFTFQLINMKEIKNITRIGIPSAAEHFSYVFFQMFLSWVVIKWGMEQLTAKTYMQSWAEYIFILSISIGQATQILVGQKLGERKNHEIKSIVNKSLIIGIILTTSSALCLWGFSKRFFNFYNINEEVISFISLLLILTIVLEPLRSINVNMVSSLYAMRETKYPLAISIISLWLFIVPVLLLFHAQLNIVALWGLMILDELFRAVLLYRKWGKTVNNRKLESEIHQPSC